MSVNTQVSLHVEILALSRIARKTTCERHTRDMIQAKIGESTVQTVEKLPHVWHRAKQVDAAFSEVYGAEVGLVDGLRPTDARGNTPHNVPEKSLVTPTASDGWLDEVRNGADHWKISDVEAFFGDSRGSENVTATVVREDLTFGETFALLAKKGHIEQSVEGFRRCAPSDPDPLWSTAYQVFILSLGWDAERILDQQTRFSKGNAAQDAGGIDGYWGPEHVQVKPVTRAASYGAGNMADEEITRLVYTWDHQGHLIATFDEPKDLKNEVAKDFGMRGKGAQNGRQSSRFWKSWSGSTTGLERDTRYLAIHEEHTVE